MFDRIIRYVGPRLRRPSRDEVAKARRSVFQFCAACGGDLSGHSCWRLGSVFVDSHKESQHLSELIKHRDWEKASQCQNWSASRDMREYNVIRCPNRPELSLVTLISLAELSSDDYVESTEVLDAQSSRTLSTVVGGRWQPI
jgi:hypothetical protein